MDKLVLIVVFSPVLVSVRSPQVSPALGRHDDPEHTKWPAASGCCFSRHSAQEVYDCGQQYDLIGNAVVRSTSIDGIDKIARSV